MGNTGHRSKDTVREGAAPPHSEWAPPKDQLDPVRTALGTTSEILAGVVLIAVSCLGARGQSQVDATTGEFWPTVNVHIQLPDNYRLLGFVESKKGEEFAYQQLDMGLGFGYQWKAIRKPHPRNIDPDKEHTFLFGGGYEYLRTLQAGKNTPYENRLVLEGMPGSRPLSRLLVRDRNRVEFRWVNGVYSTRYRNDLSLEYDITVHDFRVSPYASAEVFYNGATHSWNEEQYTAGFQWPYKRLLMLQTYYLRQNCTTCNPAHLNVRGTDAEFLFEEYKVKRYVSRLGCGSLIPPRG